MRQDTHGSWNQPVFTCYRLLTSHPVRLSLCHFCISLSLSQDVGPVIDEALYNQFKLAKVAIVVRPSSDGRYMCTAIFVVQYCFSLQTILSKTPFSYSLAWMGGYLECAARTEYGCTTGKIAWKTPCARAADAGRWPRL